jgi:hypothetical protein
VAKRSDESLYALTEVEKAFNLKKEAGIKSELTALINEAHSLRDAEARLKKVKERIIELAQGYGGGLRVGSNCAIVRYMSGKVNLNKEMLLNNGVTIEQINASMKEGNGYWQCELPRIEG